MRHPITRRSLAISASALFATPLLPGMASAQDATPETNATPAADLSLDALVGTVEPEALLAALRTAPVTTTLFPESYGASMVSSWEDDADLEGSLGGALVGGANAPLMLAFVVFPDDAASIDRLAELVFGAEGATMDARILGQPGVTFASMFGPRTILQVANVHIWGFGMPILTDPQAENPQAEPDFAYLHLLEARSVLHATIGLDHLRRVATG